jgi:hypothetical protein
VDPLAHRPAAPHQHNEALALCRRDRHPRFQRDDELPTSPQADDLLQEIDRDLIAIVWVCRHRPALADYPAACIHRYAIPLIGAAWG